VSRTRQWAAALLVAAGLLQPLGYVTGVAALRGLGIAWVLSPLPLVFSHFRGLETFSSSFTISVVTLAGREHTLALTPENYSNLGGPYNRRNVYGAVAAFGPVLTEGRERELVEGVLRYGFCRGPLPGALGVTEPLRSARLIVRNRLGPNPIDATMEAQCAP
jgi:hypothetical protein